MSNMKIVENGTEISAIVKEHKNQTITYAYSFNEFDYIKSEKTDREIFIYLKGDKILVCVDNSNPLKSIIKNNKVPISLINYSMGPKSKMLVVSYWYGIIVGLLMLGFGIYRLVKEIKNSKKTFS